MDIQFDDKSRTVMALANQKASELNCEYIGVEHVILALLTPEDGILYQKLKDNDYDVEKIRRAVTDYAVQSSYPMVIEEGTKKTKELMDVIRLAIDYANARGDKSLLPEHILYGLIMLRKRPEKESRKGPLELYGIPVNELERNLLPPPPSMDST